MKITEEELNAKQAERRAEWDSKGYVIFSK